MAPPANVGDWDYTDAQWVRISAAIKRVRCDPLNDTERDALRITANDYLVDSRDWSNKRHTVAAERKAWEQASKLISKLQDAIKRAAGIHNGLRRTKDQKFFFVTQEIMAAVLGKPQPSPETTKIKEKGHSKVITVPFHMPRDAHIMTIDELEILLSQIKLQIDLLAGTSGGPSWCWTCSGRLEPRIPYMQQILWLWTHCFGGKLTLSVDSTDIPARIYGPLVDYVSAVAGPVLKEHVLKPSTLRDVLERQKKFNAWLADFERKYRKIGCWAYNRAKAMRELDSYVEVASEA